MSQVCTVCLERYEGLDAGTWLVIMASREITGKCGLCGRKDWVVDVSTEYYAELVAWWLSRADETDCSRSG